MVSNWLDQDDLYDEDYQVSHRKLDSAGKTKRPFRHDEKRYGRPKVTHNGAHRRQDKRNYL